MTDQRRDAYSGNEGARNSTRSQAGAGRTGESRSSNGRARRTSGAHASGTRRSRKDEPLTTRNPTNARSAKRRAAHARAKRRYYLRAATGIAVTILCLVLVFLALRGLVGCVAGAISHHGDSAQTQEQAQEQTQAQKDEKTETSDDKKEKAGPVEIELVMVGDILQHAGVFQSGFRDDGTRNYDHIFAHIADELDGADIKVVNQETVLGGTAFEFSGYPTFNGPQEMGDAEADVGFNVVLRATNHALDVGYEGLYSELSFWRTKHPEVAVIGAKDLSNGAATGEEYYLFEKDGFKVALLNYTMDLNGIPDPQGAVSMLTDEHVRETVEAARAEADMVVVFPHWGEEYRLEPTEEQRRMAEVFMDAGADVIIGGHPHVLEPLEVLTASDGRKVPCFWSMGNFVSTQIDNENLVGGVARVLLQKDADGTCSVVGCELVPTVTHKGTSTDMTTYLLSDYTDDLASTNYLVMNGTDNRDLTVAWANDFCTQVLGSKFDTSTERLTIGPEAFEGAKSSDSKQQTSDDDESASTKKTETNSSDSDEPAKAA